MNTKLTLMVKNPFLLKLKDLRYNYGPEEANYFESHPYCESCPEQRLAALTIHHVHGRKQKIFKILCFNCHMTLHATKYEGWTYDDYKIFVAKKLQRDEERSQRNLKFWHYHKRGLSLRAIGRIFSVSHITVKNGLREWAIKPVKSQYTRP